jgi:hypothetical protein
MDPVSIIMGALSAVGATIGDKVIKGGYEALKALIVQKFGNSSPRLGERIEDYVQDPETNAKPAEKAIRDAGVAQDKEIVDRLAELLKQSDAVKPGVSGGLIGQLEAHRSTIVAVGGDVHGGVTIGNRAGPGN